MTTRATRIHGIGYVVAFGFLGGAFGGLLWLVLMAGIIFDALPSFLAKMPLPLAVGSGILAGLLWTSIFRLRDGLDATRDAAILRGVMQLFAILCLIAVVAYVGGKILGMIP